MSCNNMHKKNRPPLCVHILIEGSILSYNQINSSRPSRWIPLDIVLAQILLSPRPGEGRKEGTYLFDQTTIVNTIHIYENAMVRRLSLRLNIAASATATEIIIIII